MSADHNGPGTGAPVKRYQTVVSDSARWLRFRHRAGDIVVSTPPKCGTTLTQMMCALLVFDGPEFPGTLDDVSPWLDMNTRSDDEVFAELDAQGHRRFVKTHTPLDGIPEWPDVTYLVVARDPRDVFESWEHHVANVDMERFTTALDDGVGLENVAAHYREVPGTPAARMDQWLVDDDPSATMSLAGVLGHVAESWSRRDRPNVHLFHFEDLRDRRIEQMQRLADAVGIVLPQERIEELAAAASLERMRARAGELAPDTKRILADPAAFFRSGESTGGRSTMTPGQQEVYRRRVAELVPPDLAAWLHRG